MDNCEELIPEYLNFLRGFVNSDDLLLIISLEQLQKNQIIKLIRKNTTKKRLELFNRITVKKEDLFYFMNNFQRISDFIFIKIFFKTNKNILT
jgi:molecular chaperone HtpG